MQLLLFGLIWLLNLGVSFWNAYSVGKAWAESRAAGGWPRVMCWSGAVMSASGFTWCYLILLVLLGSWFQLVDSTALRVALNLGYVVLVPGILVSGLLITIDSWAHAFRRGGFLNYGMAVYNTYAQIHNTYSAITGFGGAFRSVGDFFNRGGRDRDQKSGVVVVVVLVVLALAAGVLTTTYIIWKTAATMPLPDRPPPEQFEDSVRNVQQAAR